jgi:hypothetical protein
MSEPSLQPGTATSPLDPGERVRDVHFTADHLVVDLADGRTVTAPLAWYPRLFRATQGQRENWQVCGGGYGIHWPEIDEDLSTEGLLRQAPASRRRLGAV